MGTVNIAYKQELGGWPYQDGCRAVLVKVYGSSSYNGTGDVLPIAQLGFRRLRTAFVANADLTHAANQPQEQIYGTAVDYGSNYGAAIVYGQDDEPTIVWDTAAALDNLSSTHKWFILVGSV